MKEKNTITIRIGKRVAKLRRQIGLSQYKFADKTRRTFNTISNLERGYGDPRLSTLEDCAKALNMTLSEMISEAEQIPVNSSPYFDKIIDLLKDQNDKTLSMIYDIVKTVLNAKNSK